MNRQEAAMVLRVLRDLGNKATKHDADCADPQGCPIYDCDCIGETNGADLVEILFREIAMLSRLAGEERPAEPTGLVAGAGYRIVNGQEREDFHSDG